MTPSQIAEAVRAVRHVCGGGKRTRNRMAGAGFERGGERVGSGLVVARPVRDAEQPAGAVHPGLELGDALHRAKHDLLDLRLDGPHGPAQGGLELGSAVAAPAAEDVAGEAFAVNPDKDGLAVVCIGPSCDPQTGEVRRFLTGPTNCEITGVSFTPDGRNLFISVQHPGESPTDRSDPKQPRKFSNWPDYQADGRPRSANVVIRKIDGGVIGT